MPRGNKKSPAAAAPKRASRSSTRSVEPVPEPEPEPAPTRASRGSRSGDDSTPKKVARKASPSPAPATRKESRGRTPRGKQAKATEVEEETKPEPAKGKGDAPEPRSGSRGRVTRAVVQEEIQSPRAARGRSSRAAAAPPEVEEETVAESPKPRSRSAAKSKTATPKKEAVTPKRSPRKKPEPAASSSRSRSRSAKKSAVVEVEEDEDEEEEEEEEEEADDEDPIPEKKQPKGKRKAPAKAKKSPVSKSPAQKKVGRRSAESGEIQEAQIVLTKIDDEEPHKVEEAQTTTTASRRSRSRGKKPEESTETSPSTRPSPRSRTPRAAAEKTTPTRQSRSRGSKTEETPEQDKSEESTQDEAKMEEDVPTLDSKPEVSSQEEGKMDEDMPDLNKQDEEKQESEAKEAEKPKEEPSQEEIEKPTQVEPAPAEVEPEEEEEDQPEPSAIEDISSEETAEDKQDEIELLETEDAVDAGQPPEEQKISSVDSKADNDVGMPPAVDVAQNGADQGLTSPSRKRKHDDSGIYDEDLMPKKARRSIDVEEVVDAGIQENGEEPEVMETEVQAPPVITPEVVEPEPQLVPVNSSEPVNVHNTEPIAVNDTVQHVAPPPEPQVVELIPVMNEAVAEEMETEPVVEQVPSVPVAVTEPVPEVQPPVVESSEQDVSKEYVVIDMSDVPSSDSSEVLSSLPKIPEVPKVQEEVLPAQVDQLPVQQEVPVESVQIQSEVPVVQTIDNSVESVSVDNQKTLQPTVQPEQIVSDNVTNVENNPILSREFIPNPEFEGKELDLTKQFSVISYNILAQCHLERNGYSYTEREFLELKYRHDLLMEELQLLDGDIVCLQEVEPEYYSNYLQPAFKSLGYDSLIKKRTDDYFAEGEATFYKTNRFTLVSSSTHSLAELAEKDLAETGLDDNLKASVRKYLNRPDVLVITKLQCNNTGNIVTVGNVHVHWGKMEVPDVQCVQIASAIKEVVKTAGSDMSPHILCGDFNSKEASPAYQLTTEGYLGDEMLQTLQNLVNVEMEDGSKAALVNHLWGAFQHTSSNLKSAYFVTMGCEPDISSYNEVMCATVDYQFFSMGCLDNVGVLETAAEDEVMKTGGIPNKIFPSDHISLKAKYSFK